jgi:hypothetical protein
MRKAIDWQAGLSNALAQSLENTGARGASGAKANFPNNDGLFSGTAPGTAVTTTPPLVTIAPAPVTRENQSNLRQVVGSGYQESQHLQAFLVPVTTGTAVTAENEDEEERAAIIEFDAGIPRAWAEGFARLDRQQPLAGYSATQWRQIIDDGGRFLDAWGELAAGLSWKVTDVFGIDPHAPRNRYDAMGLVFLIGGGQITAVNERSATIRRGQSELTYTRCLRAGVCVWELENTEGSNHEFR